MPYQGSSYNIPLRIWILDTHPLHAPMCFVCPTPDMSIKVSRSVDHTGRIYLPYLHEWNESTSDILGLIQICIITFSESPPVFARAQGPPQPQPQPQPHMNQYQQQPPPYPVGGSGGGGLPPYPVPPSSASSTASSQLPQEHIRASLVTAAEEKVKKVLREEFNTKQVEIESLRKVKEELQVNV